MLFEERLWERGGGNVVFVVPCLTYLIWSYNGVGFELHVTRMRYWAGLSQKRAVWVKSLDPVLTVVARFPEGPYLLTLMEFLVRFVIQISY